MSRSSLQSWGPAAWTFLHTVSFAYPEEPTQRDRDDMYAFLDTFSRVIPCRRCRDDWQALMRERLPSGASAHLDSRDALSRFVVDGHNAVNEKLGKKPVAYAKVAEWYTAPPSFAASPVVCCGGAFLMVCMALAAVCLAFRSAGARSTRRASRSSQRLRLASS